MALSTVLDGPQSLTVTKPLQQWKGKARIEPPFICSEADRPTGTAKLPKLAVTQPPEGLLLGCTSPSGSSSTAGLAASSVTFVTDHTCTVTATRRNTKTEVLPANAKQKLLFPRFRPSGRATMAPDGGEIKPQH